MSHEVGKVGGAAGTSLKKNSSGTFQARVPVAVYLADTFFKIIDVLDLLQGLLATASVRMTL